MKKINYIFLFIVLTFLGKVTALPSNAISGISVSKENKLEKSIKHSGFVNLSYSTKLNKQRRPKKPKGIQVIVPVVSDHVFKSFYNYSDLSVNEVKGTYSLLLHYAHGKRGPPCDQV